MSDRSVEELLHEHVLGAHSPCESLLASGVFPEGWVDRYLDLLASVATIYSGQAMLPRKSVWTVQFASWYLPLRYEAWCAQGQRSNSETIGQLARLRIPSELFITDGLDHQSRVDG